MLVDYISSSCKLECVMLYHLICCLSQHRWQLHEWYFHLFQLDIFELVQRPTLESVAIDAVHDKISYLAGKCPSPTIASDDAHLLFSRAMSWYLEQFSVTTVSGIEVRRSYMPHDHPLSTPRWIPSEEISLAFTPNPVSIGLRPLGPITHRAGKRMSTRRRSRWSTWACAPHVQSPCLITNPPDLGMEWSSNMRWYTALITAERFKYTSLRRAFIDRRKRLLRLEISRQRFMNETPNGTTSDNWYHRHSGWCEGIKNKQS